MSNIKTFTIRAEYPTNMVYHRDIPSVNTALTFLAKNVGFSLLNRDENIRFDIEVYASTTYVEISGQEAVSIKWLENMVLHLSVLGAVTYASYLDYETRKGPFKIFPVNHGE